MGRGMFDHRDGENERAAVMALLNSVLTQAIGTEGWWFISSTETGAVRYVLVGITIVLLLVFRPQGLLGDKEEARLGGR